MIERIFVNEIIDTYHSVLVRPNRIYFTKVPEKYTDITVHANVYCWPNGVDGKWIQTMEKAVATKIAEIVERQLDEEYVQHYKEYVSGAVITRIKGFNIYYNALTGEIVDCSGADTPLTRAYTSEEIDKFENYGIF